MAFEQVGAMESLAVSINSLTTSGFAALKKRTQMRLAGHERVADVAQGGLGKGIADSGAFGPYFHAGPVSQRL